MTKRYARIHILSLLVIFGAGAACGNDHHGSGDAGATGGSGGSGAAGGTSGGVDGAAGGATGSGGKGGSGGATGTGGAAGVGGRGGTGDGGGGTGGSTGGSAGHATGAGGSGTGGHATGGSGGSLGGAGGHATGGAGGALAGAGGHATGGTGGVAGGGGNACIPVGQACSGSDRCCAPAVICAGTCMTGVSDRNLKRDFTPVNRDEILEALEGLPLSTWSYTTEESGARHIGPMAQDFMATFHVGSSDKLIYQVDADGVAFAAIQALSRRVDRLTEENASLHRDVACLRSKLSRNRRLPGAAR
jgi:hypothetical protein